MHLAEFPAAASLEALVDDALVAEWQRLLAIRVQVNGEIEGRRNEKLFGTSLGAHVTLTASGDDLSLLRRYEADLPMLFIVSAVTLADGGSADLSVGVAKAEGVKCERCWRIVPSVTHDAEREGLCDRCADALAEPVVR